MSTFTVTKQIKWHMAHRVPNHKSKCRSNHGHTYFLEVTVEGVLGSGALTSDEGMVMDFGDIKGVMMRNVYDVLDHGSMFWERDPLVPALLQDEATKLVEVPFIPTAENIARWCFNQLKDDIDIPGWRWLRSVTVHETPTSSATYPGGAS